MVLDTRSVAITQTGVQQEFVIEHCRAQEFDLHGSDNQMQSRRFEFAVGKSRGSQHLDSPPLKVSQVLRMMHTPLSIDFMVVDPNRVFVLGQHGLSPLSLRSRCVILVLTLIGRNGYSLLHGSTDSIAKSR
jgi:hypothetical protein